tara:strand:- start:2412 stop:2993 length:582 start_codon:yes stop_codon:yes gene_type:complete
MQYKILIQLTLLAIIILISYFFFKSYFFLSTKDQINTLSIQTKEVGIKSSDTVKNISYISEDDNGNKYSIESEFADIDSNKSNLIMMKNVTATINLVNSIPIIIQSKNANYNNITYDTKFFNDVVMTHDYHIATSNNLDLEFKKNLITISDNVIYNNLSAAMEADKIEVDLITKKFEIIMNNKKELVKIKSIN